MRWALTTKEYETNNVGSAYDKTTKITKTQYITVGDIVSSAKNMLGALKGLVGSLPNYIKNFKANKDSTSAALATTAYSVAQPLLAIVTGLDVYKKLNTVINTLTPIMKLIARGTGVWCSPGNAADIGNIVLGTVQQILIALITQAVIALKEYVWNLEFKLRELTEESSITITRNLKDTSKKLNNTVEDNMNVDSLRPDFSSSSSSSSSSSPSSSSTVESNIDKAEEGLSNKAGSSVTITEEDINYITNIMAGSSSENMKFWDTAYVTEYFLDDKHLRSLRGSKNDKGIRYQDLDEEGNIVWKDSLKTNGSFGKFAHIKNNDSYIYVAASLPYIQGSDLVVTKDTEWSKDDYSMYNKDYYYFNSWKDYAKKNKNFTKVSKYEKDNYTIADLIEKYFGVFEEECPSQGIWYSTDNGITWSQSNVEKEYIGNLLEFERQTVGETEYPATIVAASYDYKGLYYTEDGSSWINALYSEDDETTNLDYGRFTTLFNNQNSKIRATAENTATATISATVNVLVRPVAENISNVAKFNTPSVIGSNSTLLKKENEILLYIHQHYAYYNDTMYYLSGARFTDGFWTNLINDIDNDVYTLEDAKNGTRIID